MAGDHNYNSVTSMCNTVTSAYFSQHQYFAVASKENYTPRLWMMVTCVDGQAYCNFHGMVQCYRQMLRIAVTLHSNFLYSKFFLIVFEIFRYNSQNIISGNYSPKFFEILLKSVQSIS